VVILVQGLIKQLTDDEKAVKKQAENFQGAFEVS
jgi:hypothetical protein